MMPGPEAEPSDPADGSPPNDRTSESSRPTHAEPSLTGGAVILAATPIGDVDDAPPRLRTLLAEADVVAAEDTRRLQALAGRLGVRIHGRIVSYHEHNEAARAAELVTAAAAGGRVLVISDAGMPGVSDPGYRVVRAAIEAGVRVTAVPGPSAVLTALLVSGLPSDRFCFEGFPPRRAGERTRWLAGLRDEARTIVLFEAPHRTAETLEAMSEAFGPDRPAAVCRELTKTYEEVRRGGLAELARWAGEGIRGEVTIVVGGAQLRASDPQAAVVEVLERAAEGERLKDAVADVAAATGLGRRDLYEAALAARGQDRAAPDASGRPSSRQPSSRRTRC
jgi:16S rRNA (cytidine1402-2'-O)-methyltransferase